MKDMTAAKGEDCKIEKVSICEVCGYTTGGTAPDSCPLCTAKKDKFKIFG